jgi:hypothetical protein
VSGLFHGQQIHSTDGIVLKENRMPKFGITLAGFAVALAAVGPTPVQSQDWTHREYPLAPPNARDNFVAPFFDGYYQNEDGTYTLSFGFMNRNDEDLIEVPLGPDNFIEPAMYDGHQPTSFPVVSYPGFGGPRERGVFSVVVPENFEGDVWWTITSNGYTTKVPGRITGGPFTGLIGFESAYALSITPQAEGSLRPIIRFSENGPEGHDITGIEAPRKLTAKVGQPLEVRFWAFDRGERELADVNMSLWKHQGPVGGMVSFENLMPLPEGVRARGTVREPGPIDIGQPARIPITGSEPNVGRFRATFDTPGEYVIRIRIDNFTSGDSAMGNQCCWSNGYVNVSVTN